MIDFKQFLTTIAAIFLALAVGVALGAGPLKGTAGEQLRNQVNQLAKDKDELHQQLLDQQAQAKYREAFAVQVGQKLVAGRLDGRKVLMIALPGADSATVKAIRELVADAGGAVTGTVTIEDKLLDPTQTQFVDDVSSQAVASVTATDLGIPATATGYQRAGYVLGRALMTKGIGVQDDAARTILYAFKDRSAGLITAPDRLERAQLAIAVAGPPASTGDTARDVKGTVALLRGLRSQGDGLVLAGPPSAAGSGGVISAVRSNGAAEEAISTVDEANLASGQVVSVLALVEQAQGGSGQYGGVGTTDGVVPPFPARPSPLPTPTPTKSSSPRPHAPSR